MKTCCLKLLFISCLLICTGNCLSANPLKIVSNRKSDYCILIDEKADEVIRFSACEMQKYIRLMTGVVIPVSVLEDNRPFINVTALNLTGGQPDPFSGDEFSISYSGQNISITGNGSRGTLFGVYEFLERLGCRWHSPAIEELMPFAEFIPASKELVAENVDLDFKFLMHYRKRDADAGSRTFSPSTWPYVIDWAAKNKTNIIAVSLPGFEKNREIIVEEVKKRGMVLMVGQHNVIQTFLPEQKYFKDHPEWFGMIGGKRTTHANGREVVFETSSEGAMVTFTENLISYLTSHPEIDIFQLWPPDVAFWSESDESLQLGTPADRMALFVKRISANVKKAGLKTRIAFLAYSYYTDHPVDMIFDKDIILEFCPINQNFKYRLSDSRSRVNREYFEQLEEWKKEFPGEIIHYSYYAKYSWRSLPVVLPCQIAREIREWHKLGETGCGMYFEPGNWLSLEINHLAFSRASADPGFNVRKWYSGYLESRFGAAAGEMKKYFRLATKISLDALITQSAGSADSRFFKMSQAAAWHMKKAAEDADTEEAKWLIGRISWQPEYLTLCLQLRASRTDSGATGEKALIEKINTLINQHQHEGTTLDRGYGYKVSLIPD